MIISLRCDRLVFLCLELNVSGHDDDRAADSRREYKTQNVANLVSEEIDNSFSIVLDLYIYIYISAGIILDDKIERLFSLATI